jgi:hypothetical protein
MPYLRYRIALVLVLSFLCCGARAQTAPVADCGLASPSFVTGAANIFNAQQEQDLGDALAEYGHLLGMFPKYVDKDPAVLEMEMKPPGVKTLFKPEDDD